MRSVRPAPAKSASGETDDSEGSAAFMNDLTVPSSSNSHIRAAPARITRSPRLKTVPNLTSSPTGM